MADQDDFDDDFYEPDDEQKPEPVVKSEEHKQPAADVKMHEDEEDEDEDEDDEDDDDDSDMEIITSHKDGSVAAPTSQAGRYSSIRSSGAKSGTPDAVTKPESAAIKIEAPRDHVAAGEPPPAVATSTIDINAKPIYQPSGKPITDVNIDADLAEHAKPWRNPGSDVSDYFNYGFDEFTWTAYCEKQKALRQEFDPKKLMEEMTMMTQQFMGMPGGPPGAPGAPQAQPGAGGPQPAGNPQDMAQMMAMMPPMDGMPPEMQAMMAQMMASGADPSQMDPAMFAAMAQGMGGPGGPPVGPQNPQGGGGRQGVYPQGGGAYGNQGFGGQQQGGGYGGYNRDNYGGRGRGRGRNW